MRERKERTRKGVYQQKENRIRSEGMYLLWIVFLATRMVHAYFEPIKSASNSSKAQAHSHQSTYQKHRRNVPEFLERLFTQATRGLKRSLNRAS